MAFSKSILRALLLNAARYRSSNVSKSVDGFRLLTKNVSAISTALSVSCGLSKSSIREELPGLRMAFRAASLVDILLVVSHPISAWSAGRHLVSLSPRAAQLLGYVKQTASPYSSMMSCLIALFDTVPAEPSFSLYLMEVRLYADLLKSSSRAKNQGALKESSAAVTESSISRFFIISSILA